MALTPARLFRQLGVRHGEGGRSVRIFKCSLIFRRHLPNQSPPFLLDLRPPPLRSGPPAPVAAKARPMPADHGLWLDNVQNTGPSRPHWPQGEPEPTIPII